MPTRSTLTIELRTHPLGARAGIVFTGTANGKGVMEATDRESSAGAQGLGTGVGAWRLASAAEAVELAAASGAEPELKSAVGQLGVVAEETPRRDCRCSKRIRALCGESILPRAFKALMRRRNRRMAWSAGRFELLPGAGVPPFEREGEAECRPATRAGMREARSR